MSKEKVKAKNKRATAKALGGVQKDNEEEMGEYMLYMWGNWPFRVELAHGTRAVAKRQFRSSYEIRFETPAPTVLQLQHKPRGARGNRLQTYVVRVGGGANGRTGKR